MEKDMNQKTAREFCASRRAVPFGAYKLSHNDSPEWRKLSGGYIGVTDGSSKAYVMAGHIFAIEIHDGMPEIYSYTRNGVTAAEATKPYALNSLYKMLSKPEEWIRKKISFRDMIRRVTSVYPDLYIPTREQFYAEYGLVYDGENRFIENPHDLKDDE